MANANNENTGISAYFCTTINDENAATAEAQKLLRQHASDTGQNVWLNQSVGLQATMPGDSNFLYLCCVMVAGLVDLHALTKLGFDFGAGTEEG